jgi:GT2 family glycosyltransferase
LSERGVAVCIVTWNSAGDLRRCFECVAAQRHRPLEVVVVDCGSTDDSAARAGDLELGSLPRSVVPLGENRGFSGGMNEAIRRSSSPLLVTLNPDAWPEPDFVSRLVERLEGAAGWRVGAVAGRLVRPEESGARRLDACGMRLAPSWRHLDRGSREVDRGQWSEAERVFGATGAASLFVRRALQDVAVDGEVFDTRFHSYREDAELCFRLRERGWEVLYEPRALAVHRRRVDPSNRSELPWEINYHSLKNRYLLRAYHQTAGNLLRTLLPTLARDLGALAYVAARERTSLAAYAWLWRHRREIIARRRTIQSRRSVPPGAVEVWFREAGLPL